MYYWHEMSYYKYDNQSKVVRFYTEPEFNDIDDEILQQWIYEEMEDSNDR